MFFPALSAAQKEKKRKETEGIVLVMYRNLDPVRVTSSSDHDFLLNQILPVFVPAYSQYYR